MAEAYNEVNLVTSNNNANQLANYLKDHPIRISEDGMFCAMECSYQAKYQQVQMTTEEQDCTSLVGRQLLTHSGMAN